MLIVKLFAKLLALPLLLIIRLFGALLYGVSWAAAHVAGPFLFCYGGFAVYSVFQKEWTNAIILTVVCGLVYGVFIAAGVLLGLIQSAAASIRDFLWS